MSDYLFANSTSATYNFFLYDFCDVYLELLKARLQCEDTPENAADKKAARDVLYICLDWSLRLMHPLLPYLTEELYQRLPPSPNKYESIVIASYPMHVLAWNNDIIEEEFETVSEICKRIRSQKTSMGFAPSARPKVFVRHADEYWQGRLKPLCGQLSRMGQVGDVQLLAANAKSPKGTISDVVNQDCLIFTEVTGLDLSQELVKLKKKVENAVKTVASFQAKMNVPGYEDKVPEPVREKNANSLKEAQVEVEELQRAVASIQALK